MASTAIGSLHLTQPSAAAALTAESGISPSQAQFKRFLEASNEPNLFRVQKTSDSPGYSRSISSSPNSLNSDAITGPTEEKENEKLKEVFQQFVAQTFFGLMLKEMRKSVHHTPYFHGGLAEEIFQQHLDMTLAERLAQSSGHTFAEPMFELFRLQTRNR